VPDDEQKKDETQAPAPPAAEEPVAPPAEAEAADKAPDDEKDRFRPEAIASRVASLGEEDESDRIARQEEDKLRERRKAKKGKKGLESAASKRLAKIGEAKVKRPGALDASLAVDTDPLVARTAAARKWIEKNKSTFALIVGVGVLGASGFVGYTYWQQKHQADASAMLAQGIADEHGVISDKDEDDEEKHAPLYPTFKTVAERRDAAIAKYKDVESKYAGTGAAILARLAEAGLLLDKGDAKGSAAAYEDVKGSALAQADAQVRGRALEGIGFCDELLAVSDAAAKEKHLDDALAAFKQLEGIDVKGWKELGKYHEARVQEEKGDKAKAVELLKDVRTAIDDHSGDHPFAYLESVVDDRLRQLDPSALPPRAPKMPAGLGGGDFDPDDPRVQELLRQLQQRAGQGGGGPGGGPKPPVPAP
jgi:hypothetical protein